MVPPASPSAPPYVPPTPGGVLRGRNPVCGGEKLENPGHPFGPNWTSNGPRTCPKGPKKVKERPKKGQPQTKQSQPHAKNKKKHHVSSNEN